MNITDPSPTSLQKSTYIQKFNGFLRKPQYIMAVCGLSLISNLFCHDLAASGIYTLLSLYIFLFSEDLLPFAPICVSCYIAPSVGNNPGKNDSSVFSGAGGICILVCGILIAAGFLYRLIRDRKLFLHKRYAFLPGMLLLFAAYLAGGIGSEGYREKALQHLVFALLQGASVIVFYLVLSGGVRWDKTTRDYFPWIGLSLGGVLFAEILWIYLQPGTVIAGVIHRENIYTGWGIHNNLGGMLAMMIPFAFYLATKYRRGWMGTVFGSLFLAGVILTCSRNAILTGGAIYFICIVLMLYYARNRKGNTIAALVCVGVASLGVILFSQQLLQLFSDILTLGFDPNSRDSIYTKGLLLFKKYPVFGGSFFAPPELSPWGWSQSESFTGFFPARWHNTFIQLLASCGIVGLISYLPHRIQVFFLILRKPTKERAFIGCSILVLLICSLFDCHLFNIGPTLFYSVALAFLENLKTE